MKELIGRSRNERKLDGIYNKQRDILVNRIKNKKNNDIYLNLSKRKTNEPLPFPEIYEKKRKVNKQNENEEKNVSQLNNKVSENNTTVYKGIYMILSKHIYSKNKFFKSVSIFTNLCINYMNNDNKTIFFYAFDHILNVFLEKYLYDDIKKNNIYTFYNYDELHIKCVISFFDKVINKIIDNRFIINNKNQENASSKEEGESITVNEKSDQKDLQENQVSSNTNNNDNILNENLKNNNLPNLSEPKNNLTKINELSYKLKDKVEQKVDIIKITKEEKKFLKLLKIKIYYLIILFKLNDNFVFNKLINIYRQIFEEIQNEFYIYEEKINEEKSKKVSDDTQLINENNVKDEENNNKLTQEKNVECNNDKLNDEEIINDYLSYFKGKWKLPSDYEIFKIKRNAFVKCLSNLFHFINIAWAKTSVESLFQDVYLKKKCFDICDEIIIENLQSSIKANINKRKSKYDSPHLLSIGESLNPVIDARDEKIISIHGSHIWSNKQMER
ncbi:conserved Plasmodium protein, unknown function [Plasmodium gallinaceum]|uniref:Uncharacterized protein n=1 Tax=Plasmodium gallinaceum TaxID=5849 RepID=A0A1J1H0B0_PLAGA|nr:conserved Plasmodium protein, unknown function [Plasmodium gallinaceum]CRG98132.1 conserved Plasmodium protein, unknown function [Plasmodium gallinaceum]